MAAGADAKRIADLERRLAELERRIPRERDFYRQALDAERGGLKRQIEKVAERVRQIEERPIAVPDPTTPA